MNTLKNKMEDYRELSLDAFVRVHNLQATILSFDPILLERVMVARTVLGLFVLRQSALLWLV